MTCADDRADLIADLSSPAWIERAASEFRALRRWRWAPAAPSPAAERMRRTRARRAAGLLVLRVEAPEHIADVLRRAGFLQALEPDHAAIEAATEQLLARLSVAELSETALRATTGASDLR